MMVSQSSLNGMTPNDVLNHYRRGLIDLKLRLSRTPLMQMLIVTNRLRFLMLPLTWVLLSYADIPQQVSPLIVVATGTGTTCGTANGTITAVASGGTSPYSYSLDGINFQPAGVFTGLQSITYTITTKDASGATSSTSLTLTNTYVMPDFQFSPVQLLNCTSTDGYFAFNGFECPPPYSFSLDNIDYSSTGYFGNLSGGYYTIFMRDGDGCITSYPEAISNNCSQPFSYRYQNPGCSNSDGWIILSQPPSGPPITYSLNGGPNVSSATYANLPAGKYVVQVMDANGPIETWEIPLFYNCTFSVGSSVVNATCGQQDGSITVSTLGGAGPYQYSIDGTNYTANPILNNLAPGTYVIRVKDPNGLINMASATVGTCAAVNATATAETCGQKNGTITASGTGGTPSYLYSLDGTAYQTSNFFTGLAAGSYTVTIKDAVGSVNTTAVTVAGTQGASLTVTPFNPSCKGDDGQISVTGSSASLPISYSINGSPYQQDGDFPNLGQGQYIITAKDGNGCVSTTATTLNIANTLTISTGASLTICAGIDAGLMASGNGNQWSWTPTAGLNNPASPTPKASPAVTTTYYVIESLNACTLIDSQTVFVNPAPTADAGADVTTCYGKDVQLQGSGGQSCEWSPSTYLNDSTQPDPIVNHPLNSVTYHLTVIDAQGCKSLNSAVAQLYVTPPAKLFAGDDTAVVQNQPVQLHAIDVNNSGFSTYNWSPSYGLDNPDINDPVATLTEGTTYVVTASTADGCESTDTIRVTVYTKSGIYVPNAFTPNGDGRNDVFRPILIGVKKMNYFAIYNRWGQQVYKTESNGAGWDGRVNGEMQLPGAYVWQVSGVDYQGNNIQSKGTVILIR
jgi:gliding motility-associated-like protein